MAAVVKCQAVKKDGQSCRNTGKVTRDQVTYCGVHDPYKSRNGIQVVTIDQPNWVKVIDDPDSWVAVYQGWVEDADSLFKDLKENVPWHFRKVKMRGRDVAIPRGSFFLCEDRANYPGATNKDKLNHAIWEDSTSESDYINLVRSLLDKINHDRTIKKLTKQQLNFKTALLHLYRDGKDSISPHSDKEACYHKREWFPTVVVGVSLGATRKFRFREKVGSKRKIDLFLKHGDVVIMGGHCQRDWTHEIPKISTRVSERISLTFRYLIDLP